MREPKNLRQVHFVWDDGTVQSLKEPEAQKWLEAVNSASMLAGLHQVPFPVFDWQYHKHDPEEGEGA